MVHGAAVAVAAARIGVSFEGAWRREGAVDRRAPQECAPPGDFSEG
jgi:hypothetical protein